VTEQFSCPSCEDGAKLNSASGRCRECGRESKPDAFFEGGEKSIAASMDEAFDEIVLGPATATSPQTRPIWWYVNNGRRIGPVSLDELRAAVSEASEPHNVLIWNEGFSNWRRYGEVEEFKKVTTDSKSTALEAEQSTSLEAEGPAPESNKVVESSGRSDVSLLSDLEPIEEDALIPEGQPIDDWTPSAAFSLRGIASSDNAPIAPESWEEDGDEEGDDIGLPPSIDTTEFKRDELFATPSPKSGPSVFVVMAVGLLLAIGAYVAGQQFWSPQPLEEQSRDSKVQSTTTQQPLHDEGSAEAKALPSLPPTTIEATPPQQSVVKKAPKKKSTRKMQKKRKVKKSPRLNATLTKQELEAGLKKNSASLAPCIEGAVNSKELPAGRHVMKLAYDILPSGRIGSASLIGPKYLLGGALSRCVESTIVGWRFPKTAKGHEVRGQELAFRARAP